MNLTSASFALLVLFSASTGVLAQHSGHQSSHQTGHHQAQMAYAGLQHRHIKALSSQQIEDLRAGRGMSQALAAELNGYPGPMHAMELGEQLKLTAEQQTKIQALFGAMQKEAKALGEDLIAAERELDALFKSRRITPSTLDSQTQKIAQIQGRLRAVHLHKHLEMTQMLTADQVDSYNRMRGY